MIDYFTIPIIIAIACLFNIKKIKRQIKLSKAVKSKDLIYIYGGFTHTWGLSGYHTNKYIAKTKKGKKLLKELFDEN